MKLYKVFASIALLAAIAATIYGYTNTSCGDLCSSAFNSSFSKFFGVPVGILSVISWVYILTETRLTRLGLFLTTCMGVGACGFLGILFLYIQALCVVCCIHNFSAILAAICAWLYWRKHIALSWRAELAIYYKLPIYIIAFLCILFVTPKEHKAYIHSVGSNLHINMPILSKEYVGEADIRNGIIISLTCPHCYNTLGQLLSTNPTTPTEINLIFKAVQGTTQATVKTVATILQLHKNSGYANMQKVYQTVLPLLFKHHEELEKGEMDAYEKELESLVEVLDDDILNMAGYIVSSHTMYYSTLGTNQTPILIDNFRLTNLQQK